ncbi:patatin-like phospholipase family protein [Crenobacter cavernae]|uniref:Patatin-like phospholipase family protein n=1 Tax=Crenobacter cavernae TaxID=2290923 RepID=A0A345Y4C2_9NEIS|nr:patatin-like phospholipase family protein [Crenobacter cavernae]AXK38774.1 patatin-like phospholipase family protein [Crenobacter cavernae]
MSFVLNLKRCATLATLALAAACTTPTAPIKPAEIKPPPRIKVALALGGGAAKGFAHIGVIKVLEQAGIPVDIVTGTSAGSVVGSLYASGLSGLELQKKAIELDESRLADVTLSRSGFIKGEALAGFINQMVGNRPIEKLARPFAAVATDLDSGEKKVFRSGNTGQAVRASASIPNVFQPVTIGSRRYVDGGLVSPVPVSAAREMGADFVIAVDISAKPQGGAGGFLSMLDQSINIMNKVALAQELKQADVIIRPQVQQLGSTAFAARNQTILEGERVGLLAVPVIKKMLAQKVGLIAAKRG